jgi:hypothetical protein
MERRGILRSNLDRSIQIERLWLFLLHRDGLPRTDSARCHGRGKGALVLGLGCFDLDAVSPDDIGMTRRNILLTFGGGDSRGWAGNGGAVWTKLYVDERSSGDLPSKARVGPALEKSGDASRPGSGAQSDWALVAACGESLRQWGSGCRLIRMGRAPIYRGKPIYS